MSFGPPRLISTPPKKDKTKSPPRFSAEIAAKFDANIREFDPTRRKSPKDFLRRKTVPSFTSPRNQQQTNSNNKNNLENNPFASQNNQNDNNNNHKRRTSSTNSKPPSTGRRTSSARNNNNNETERRPRKIFGGESNNGEEDFFKIGNRRNSSSSIVEGGNFPDFSNNTSTIPFYKLNEVSPEWIRVHAKINETLMVQSLVRERIEKLQLDQFRLLVKFKNELEI